MTTTKLTRPTNTTHPAADGLLVPVHPCADLVPPGNDVLPPGMEPVPEALPPPPDHPVAAVTPESSATLVVRHHELLGELERVYTKIYLRVIVPVARGFCRGLPSDQAEAFVQAVAERVFSALGDVRDPSAFRAWVQKIATNVFEDWKRGRPRLRRHREAP